MYPIRILQVVTIMNRGGLETMLMNYYREIDRTAIQFDFMVHRAERGHYDDEIESLGGNIIRMPPIRPGNYRSYFKKLDAFFAAHPAYRVVHAHLNENSSFVLRSAKRAGIPCRIAHSHLSDLHLDYKLPFRWFARLAMKNQPNHFFACSKKAGDWLFGAQIAQSEQLTLLHNAVNTLAFSYDQATRQQIRQELNVHDRFVIGHVGRFNRQKNHLYLIDIFKAVHARHANAILLLVGEGPLKPMIEHKVAALGLSDSVQFLGVRQDIPQLMQGFDLFLFPSLFEGLPVVLIEAQAAGLTCVVANTITAEANVTGDVQFVSLKASPEHWANVILKAPFERKQTAHILKNKGYDAVERTAWLSNYYKKFSLEG